MLAATMIAAWRLQRSCRGKVGTAQPLQPLTELVQAAVVCRCLSLQTGLAACHHLQQLLLCASGLLIELAARHSSLLLGCTQLKLYSLQLPLLLMALRQQYFQLLPEACSLRLQLLLLVSCCCSVLIQLYLQFVMLLLEHCHAPLQGLYLRL